jgi:hypothetical protein
MSDYHHIEPVIVRTEDGIFEVHFNHTGAPSFIRRAIIDKRGRPAAFYSIWNASDKRRPSDEVLQAIAAAEKEQGSNSRKAEKEASSV